MKFLWGGGEKQFVIVGAGDFADLVADLIVSEMHRQLAGYAVDQKYLKQDVYHGLPVRPYEEICQYYPPENYTPVIGFVGSHMYDQRYEKYKELKALGYEMENVIHPTAQISSTSRIGDGNIFLPYTIAGTGSRIGNCNFFAPQAYVCHHVTVGDSNYFAPNASTTGYVEIGNNCFLGANSAVNNKVKVADYTFVGGGVFISKDTKPYEIYAPKRSIPQENASMRMHHVGYYVKDIDKSRKKYEQLGFSVSKRVGNQEVQSDYGRNIKILFMENRVDSVMIELVELLDESKKSPLDFIRKGNAGNYSDTIPYHICYEVEDIDRAVEELRKQHFVVINPKEETTDVLFHKNVTFLFNKAAGIIELIEK